jgi:hypothetical protein
MRRAEGDDQVPGGSADSRHDGIACESAVPGSVFGFDEAFVDHGQTVLAASEAELAPRARHVTGEGGRPVGSDDCDRGARPVEIHIRDRGPQ